MTKYIFLILLSTSVFAESNKSKEQYVVINLPTDPAKQNKDDAIKQEEALKLILKEKFPLSVGQLKTFQEKRLKEKAVMDSIKTADNYVSDVVYTSLEPGSKSIPISLSRGLPLSIILKDTSGDPVDFYALIDSSTQYLACKPGTCSSSNNNSDADTENGRPGNILVLQAKAVLGGGVLPVYTTQSDFPLSFNIKIKEDPGQTYVDRLVVIVNTGKQTIDENPASLKSLDTLTRALNGISPVPDATAVYFNGPIKAWKKGDVMWIRTPYEIKIPTISNSASKLSLNGVNAYKVRYSSIISLMDHDNGIIRYQEEQRYE